MDWIAARTTWSGQETLAPMFALRARPIPEKCHSLKNVIKLG